MTENALAKALLLPMKSWVVTRMAEWLTCCTQDAMDKCPCGFKSQQAGILVFTNEVSAKFQLKCGESCGVVPTRT